MGRNPIQNAGCFGILKSVKDNPDSAMEALDFSVTHTHPTTMRPSAKLLFKYIHLLLCVPLSLGHHSEPRF